MDLLASQEGSTATILIVEDSATQALLLQSLLEGNNYRVAVAGNGLEALEYLDDHAPDLIISDIIMPQMDGYELCHRINMSKQLKDIPIIMVTAMSEKEKLQLAFAAGAMDFIAKPVDRTELFARVRSLLKLKYEMDRRKAREQELLEVTKQLQEANLMLQRLSELDGLTNIANRRCFDVYLDQEWRRATRTGSQLSMLMIDIDYFKLYNDTYGHQAGDECLRNVSKTLNHSLKRGGDFAARYGGEEFAIILPETDITGAVLLAQAIRAKVEELNISHAKSEVSDRVTISIGAASILPEKDLPNAILVTTADQALYQAKRSGRNQVRWALMS
ncbi:MAG: PleD family two-component system response regulator [Deltaproteobacteria bacterium]|nr:PleD family two-component system response regulator [Deltaproteobacteria bacterium]